MDMKKEISGMLDLLTRPGFFVKDNQITAVNLAAQNMMLTPGTDIRELLLTGQEEYAAFQEGCLYLTLALPFGSCGASVFRVEEQDCFLLDQDSDDDALRAMALAARTMREPLSNMMVSLRQLAASADPDQAAQLNRNMHQMLRLISNMSDAGRSTPLSQMESRDIPEVFSEIFEKAETLGSQAGVTIRYQSSTSNIFGLVDEDLLERAVWNLLSNAIKSSPKGSTIQAQLSRRGNRLTLSILDCGSGIPQNLQQTLFQRYLRQPGLEDSQFGIGLGMVLIRNAAARHGGTVLIDQPGQTGTRVSFTMTIRQDIPDTLRSPIMRVDYSGGLDHGLVELSDCLPASSYYMD